MMSGVEACYRSLMRQGKMRKKLKFVVMGGDGGPSFINLPSPCIPDWKIDADMAVESAREGVECRFWPLFEVENGKFTIDYRPGTVKPVNDWVFSQGRFKHLKKHPEVIAAFQAEVDKQWAWLEGEEKRG